MKRLLACALFTRTYHAAVNVAAQQTFHMAYFWHTPHGKYIGFYTPYLVAV